jgi:hypothetical protein
LLGAVQSEIGLVQQHVCVDDQVGSERVKCAADTDAADPCAQDPRRAFSHDDAD